MRTRILAAFAALAASHAPAFAQGSVQLNGVFDVYAGQRQLAGAGRAHRVESGGMTTSRWGVDGAEDLGGGLKAVFALSAFLRVDSGDTGRSPADGFWRRAAYVGLEGSWGSLRLGRVVTPTFVNAIRFSPFADSSAFGPYIAHVYTGAQPMVTPMTVPDSAADNAIAYGTPVLGGFSGTLMLSMGETPGTGDRLVAAGSYAVGPFAAGLGGERVKAPHSLPAGVSRIDHLQAGLSWDLKALKLFGTWARSEMTLPAGTRDLHTWQLGLTAPAGAGLLMAAWGSTSKREPALADARRRTLSVGYDHPLSKRTDLYAVAMRDQVTSLSNGHTLALGVRHRF
ncbi:MAG: porin [Rubrivivax sp.]